MFVLFISIFVFIFFSLTCFLIYMLFFVLLLASVLILLLWLFLLNNLFDLIGSVFTTVGSIAYPVLFCFLFLIIRPSVFFLRLFSIFCVHCPWPFLCHAPLSLYPYLSLYP